MSELNKKYLEQSGVQEIVKKLASVAAHLSSTDAQLTEFIEKIGNILYGEGSGFPYDEVTDYQKAEPIAKKLSELLALVGEWTENEQYLPDDDMNNTVIDVLKRVRDLVGKFADEQNEEGKTVIEYFQDAIDAEIERATKAEAGLQEQLGEGFDKDNTVANAIDAVKEGFTGLLYNEEAGEKPFEAEEGKTVRGEIVKTRDYIRDNVFVGAKGEYANGWMDIAFLNADGEVIGAEELKEGKALEGENVTLQFDLTKLTRDAFLDDTKQVKVITAAGYAEMAGTPTVGQNYYEAFTKGLEIIAKISDTANTYVAYDVNTMEIFAVSNAEVAEQFEIEFVESSKVSTEHLYLIFVFELKSDEEGGATKKDTVWVDVANLVKSYRFSSSLGQDFDAVWGDENGLEDYQVDKWFEFNHNVEVRADDADHTTVTYTLNIKKEFAEQMQKVDLNAAEIEKLKDFVGYTEDTPTDGPTLQEQIDAEVERAEAAEQEINNKLGNHGKDAEGNTLYDDFNEDLEAETVIGAVNEVDDKVNALDEKVGNLEDLNEDLSEAKSVVDAVNKLDEKVESAIGNLSDWEDHEGNKHETVLDAVKALDDCVDNLENWIDENVIEIGDSSSVAGDGTITGMFKEAFGEDYDTYFE